MNVIQSAWGIIYLIDDKNTPKFLLIKRHAMSGKIEWVAPKGKIQPWESVEQAAIREVWEEAWLQKDKLVIEQKIGATSLRSSHEMKWGMDKDITYFLMHYHGQKDDVCIQPVEWYLGIYKRASLEEAMGLIYYQNMREIILQAHNAIGQQLIKKRFLDTI